MATTMESNETSSSPLLSDRLREVEDVIDAIDKGSLPPSQRETKLDDCIRVLEEISREVSARAVFSTNENWHELPTSSLPFLLAPGYLAVAYQNSGSVESRVERLKIAKIYWRDFLSRLHRYEVVGFRLPWLEADENGAETSGSSRLDPGQRRAESISRQKQLRELETAMANARARKERARLEGRDEDDDELTRECYMVQLRLWALRALRELSSIEDELPLAAMMAQRASARGGDLAAQPSGSAPPPPLRPFIIARNEEQKRVFGVGYPSIPTLTVNEWFDQMAKERGWSQQPVQSTSGTHHDHHDGDDCCGEDDKDAEQDGDRQRQMRMDDYKDTHRRGWGNTHNKG